jgi:hypothetical protein
MKASLLLRQPARAAPFFESRYPLEQPRGSLSFPALHPEAWRPQKMAMFNAHTEALEPMAGATLTRYDAPSYARGWRQ